MHIQLSKQQFLFLSIWLVLGTGILLLPAAVGRFVMRDGWITAALSVIGGLAIVAVVFLFTLGISSGILD